MNNEPYGWVDKLQTFITHDDYLNLPPELQQGMKPLYTYRQITPLTEDECEAIINKHDWFSKSWREMAKEIHDAILRKASK
jgi:hypothetical protein